MSVGLYFDAHVDYAIAGQLRLRHVDVLTAQEDSSDRLTDELLLLRATQLRRPLVTHDIRFHAMARDWQNQGRAFCGLIYGHLMFISIGQCVKDLELIAQATEEEDWTSVIMRLPL